MAKGKGGRPPKYEFWLTEDGLTLLKEWARQGLTDSEIAEKMREHQKSNTPCMKVFYEWKARFREFREAIEENKYIPNAKVANAVFEDCFDRDYWEETWERRLNRETGDFEMIMTKRVKKHVLGNQRAREFYLGNRDGWSNKQDVNVTGTLEHEQSKLDAMLEELGMK